MISALLMAAVLAGPVGPFPDRLSAFVWRNWFCVSRDRMAETVGARPEDLDAIAAEMGLPAQPPILADWRRKGYITVVRRNWDILDRRQVERMADMTEAEFAFRLKEEDFLSSKLGPKADCGALTYDRAAADRARPARLALREIAREEGLCDFSEEPRFQFVRDIRRISDRPSPPPEGGSPFDLRMIFSYFADYADPLGDDEVGSYPEGLLQKLAADGVNAVWLHVVLSQLVRDPNYPEFGEGSERRLANLRKLVARAAKHGMRVYLYINEPRAQPAAFFERGDRHAIRGLRWKPSGVYTMCTSVPEVRRWLHDSMKRVFTEVKGLGGIFTITMSENLSNCASGQTKADCPRCRSRATADILVEVNEAIISGMREGDPAAEAIAWNWQWPAEDEAEIISRLPPCRVMAVSEKGATFTRGGVSGTVEADYSVSVVGPGPLADRTWRTASARGLPTVAKVQASSSWELSTFPYVPAMDLVAEHACRLARTGVSGVMLSWSCGAAPAPNLGVFRDCRRGDEPSQVLDRLAKRLYGDKAAQARAAWTEFSNGFREFPFDWPAIYYNPLQWGPAAPLCPEKTGLKATMVGFPRDDLARWTGRFPAEVWARQMDAVAEGFARGIRLMEGVESKREVDLYRAEMLHFASAADQARFLVARDRGDRAAMAEVARHELKRAKEYLALIRGDSRIGYECSNHYFAIPQDVREKILQCAICGKKADRAE